MTQEKSTIPDLHDAILLSIELKWEENIAALYFEPVQSQNTGNNRVVVTSSGISLFSYQHRQPWGRSVYVNMLEITDSPTSEMKRFQLQMQSGDLIEFEAESILFESTQH